MLLVLGDVMTDVYVHGLVERLSPDAPVPVLRRTRSNRRMSGACISARAARDASESAVTLAAVTGDDEQADFLAAELQDTGVTPRLTAVSGCATVTKTRFLTGAHHLLRVDDDSSFHEYAPAVAEHLLDVWGSVRESVSAVLFSDYVKGGLPEAAISLVVSGARARGLPVVVDSKRRDMSAFHGASAWTPNEHELELVSGRSDLCGAADGMRSRLGLDALVVTRAAEGAVVTTDAGTQRVPASPVPEVRSVAGAGDIFAGVLTAHVARGLGWVEAAQAGVACATRYVTQDPIGPPQGA